MPCRSIWRWPKSRDTADRKGEILAARVANKLRSGLRVAVKGTGFCDRRKAMLEERLLTEAMLRTASGAQPRCRLPLRASL